MLNTNFISKMLNKFFLMFGALSVSLIIWQWTFLVYGIRQAEGQIRVILGARPIEEVMNDPNFPDSLKSKLLVVEQARRFATEKIGLEETKNYTTLYDQKGKVLLWNISASQPFALEAYQWWYPFLGKMPYKGFFDLENARKEKTDLINEGLDARIRPVGGWSTLGILPDPILSNMLNRSEGALAELIIHELTHATLFVKEDIAFNENLASFIGEIGARQFLHEKYGSDSTALKQYIASEKDSELYRTHMLRGSNQLDSLYNEIENLPYDLKLKNKRAFISKIVSSLDTIRFHNQRYYNIFSKNLPNNAHFMSYRRYHSKKDSLQGIYDSYGQSLPKMLVGLKEQYGH